MNVDRVQKLLVQRKVTLHFADHAIIEARKDGLTTEDLEEAGIYGEAIEDYDVRALFLNFTKEDGLPYHVVLEYAPSAKEVVVVTAYIPDSKEWEPNWKKRRRKRRV